MRDFVQNVLSHGFDSVAAHFIANPSTCRFFHPHSTRRLHWLCSVSRGNHLHNLSSSINQTFTYFKYYQVFFRSEYECWGGGEVVQGRLEEVICSAWPFGEGFLFLSPPGIIYQNQEKGSVGPVVPSSVRMTTDVESCSVVLWFPLLICFMQIN